MERTWLTETRLRGWACRTRSAPGDRQGVGGASPVASENSIRRLGGYGGWASWVRPGHGEKGVSLPGNVASLAFLLAGFQHGCRHLPHCVRSPMSARRPASVTRSLATSIDRPSAIALGPRGRESGAYQRDQLLDREAVCGEDCLTTAGQGGGEQFERPSAGGGRRRSSISQSGRNSIFRAFLMVPISMELRGGFSKLPRLRPLTRGQARLRPCVRLGLVRCGAPEEVRGGRLHGAVGQNPTP
jgi:hypothetical protein